MSRREKAMRIAVTGAVWGTVVAVLWYRWWFRHGQHGDSVG